MHISTLVPPLIPPVSLQLVMCVAIGMDVFPFHPQLGTPLFLDKAMPDEDGAGKIQWGKICTCCGCSADGDIGQYSCLGVIR